LPTFLKNKKNVWKMKNVTKIKKRKNVGFYICTAVQQVIIFLDAHTEVNVGWLEPLLDQLKRNEQQVIQPFIDGIDMRTLQFASPGIYYKGAFSWDLRYVDELMSTDPPPL